MTFYSGTRIALASHEIIKLWIYAHISKLMQSLWISFCWPKLFRSKNETKEMEKMNKVWIKFGLTRKIPDFKWPTSNLHSSSLSFSFFIGSKDTRTKTEEKWANGLWTRNINLCAQILGKCESFNLSFLVWAFFFCFILNECVCFCRVIFSSSSTTSSYFPLSH